MTNQAELEQHLTLTDEERAYFSSPGEGLLPLRISRYWLKIMGKDPRNPLRLQSVPRAGELDYTDEESEDPLGDRVHSPVEGLIHHYGDRALILITDRCAMYCRHCFRRHFTGRTSALGKGQIDRIIEYLREHGEIHELLISGGDGLMASYERLAYLFQGLNSLGRPLIKRIGTRLPVVDPKGTDRAKLDLLGEQKSLWMVLQVNHVSEMSPEFDRMAEAIRMRGIPLLNQAVLLRGVNDTVEAQRDLCYGLIERGIKPYYLFQGDLARGTSHFRVPLERALEIYGELSRSVSHLALPRFALDLPGGGGKVNLEESSFVKRDDRYYYFRNGRDEIGRYPRESE